MSLALGQERRPICEPCIDMRWKLEIEAFEKPSRRPREPACRARRRRGGRKAVRQSGSQADTLHRPAPLQGKCKRHANANANANANASASASANLASQEGGQQRAAIVSDRTGHRNVRELGGGRRDQRPETRDEGGERSRRARLAGM